MAKSPLGKKPAPQARPNIWAKGDQRPSFDLRAYGRASLHLSREAVAPILGGAARRVRRLAVKVQGGAGRIPEAKLGRAARFVPSHLRVAAWIKNGAAVLAHASATADPNIRRGNALVAEIEPHLWHGPAVADPTPPHAEAEPVVLAEPMQPGDDPLAAIRDDLESGAEARAGSGPPAPPGALATGAIQVSGYALGWLTSFAALPYGLVRAGWLHIRGVDLRRVGGDD